ncbi:methyltransferase [Providencia rustigianii]|uniref:methyltransferase n=1 Tax=Providencia rustigianii TaxID=158850 RepID=UPI000D946F1D|nr:methyltransferase [Providencia rustigianii]SPY78111.1 Multifunctional cyclase-dehydratase-3-O-methyl transferase tcmN [Providencia rustigianii]
MNNSLPNNHKFNQLELGIQLLNKATGFMFHAALCAAVKLKLAETLEAPPKTAEQIAQEIGAIPTVIQQILRILATQNIFTSTYDECFTLTPEAEFLLESHPYSLRNAVLMFTDQTFWMPSYYLSDMAKGVPIFEKLFGGTFYEYWEKNVDLPENFHAGMASYSRLENPFIVDKYPFPENSLIADIAGGRGGLLLEVLKSNPLTHGILFDRLIITDKHLLHQLGDDSRWETQTGSFFDSTPAADFYLLKAITHDWDNEKLINIFNVIRRSMKKTSKLLLIDTHVINDNKPNFGKNIGLICSNLMIGADGRTKEELENLLAQADLKINRIIKTDCHLSITEVQPNT